MKLPNFKYERMIWKRGYKFVAGCDEVGRGCLAGPVIAACCVFNPHNPSTITHLPVRIDDSKKLSAKLRELADSWIKENSLTWGVGKGTVAEINKYGLSKATNSAFRRAMTDANNRMNVRIDYLLIDAFYIPYIRQLRVGKRNGILERRNPKIVDSRSRQLAIVNGDEKSISIAAASIIAKVYRDNMMVRLSQQTKYKKYGWDKNKGYGTKEHQKALRKYGVTKLHRSLFVSKFLD